MSFFGKLDLEMSFSTGEDVMRLVERLVSQVWKEALPTESLPLSFPRMSYHEAMSRYGSDKPYPALGMEVGKTSPLNGKLKKSPLSSTGGASFTDHIPDHKDRSCHSRRSHQEPQFFKESDRGGATITIARDKRGRGQRNAA